MAQPLIRREPPILLMLKESPLAQRPILAMLFDGIERLLMEVRNPEFIGNICSMAAAPVIRQTVQEIIAGNRRPLARVLQR